MCCCWPTQVVFVQISSHCSKILRSEPSYFLSVSEPNKTIVWRSKSEFWPNPSDKIFRTKRAAAAWVLFHEKNEQIVEKLLRNAVSVELGAKIPRVRTQTEVFRYFSAIRDLCFLGISAFIASVLCVSSAFRAFVLCVKSDFRASALCVSRACRQSVLCVNSALRVSILCFCYPISASVVCFCSAICASMVCISSAFRESRYFFGRFGYHSILFCYVCYVISVLLEGFNKR